MCIIIQCSVTARGSRHSSMSLDIHFRSTQRAGGISIWRSFCLTCCLLWTFALFIKVQHRFSNAKKIFVYLLISRRTAVCGLPAWRDMKLKPTSYGSGQPKDHTILCSVHEEVNTLLTLSWIEQSEAHIIQNTVQTDWQLLGRKVLRVSLRGRATDTEAEKEGLSTMVVMLSETLPQCCVLLLCISHCWRPSLSGQSSVSTETSASQLECPKGNSNPKAGSDGWMNTVIPSLCLQDRRVQGNTNILKTVWCYCKSKVYTKYGWI